MKKITAALILIALVFGAVSVGAQARRDGFYFAEGKEFTRSGWKYQAVIEVKGGRIVSANWNGINSLGQPDKKTQAAAGVYRMNAPQGEWHVQAARVEAELIRLQDPTKFVVKADAKTDAISGVSITIKEFTDLAVQALAAAPVPKGTYKKDGWFFFRSPTFDNSGYAATALVTVVNGTVVSANWNALHRGGGDSKFMRSVKGTYKMTGNKQGEWHVQAPRVEAELVKLQDPAKIAVKSDGKTDAISGVSITISEFKTVATEALKAAR